MVPVRENSTDRASPARYRRGPDIYTQFKLPPFPYTCRLSFVPLLRHWKQLINSSDPSNRLQARAIAQHLKKTPAFNQPIDSLDQLNENADLVDLLISGFFPSLMEATQLANLSKPFNQDLFYMTQPYRDLVLDENLELFFDVTPEFISRHLIVLGGMHILKRAYNYDLEMKGVFPFGLRRRDAPIEFYYEAKVNSNFVDVVPVRPLPELSPEQLQELMRHVDDAAPWLEAFPPDSLEFQGVNFTWLTEVTQAETISQLKHLLLERNALLSDEKIHRLRTKLCSFFNLPELDLGVTTMDFPQTGAPGRRYPIHHQLVHGLPEEVVTRKQDSPLIQKALAERREILVENLAAEEAASPYEAALLQHGFHSLLIVPLWDQEKKIIGLLELGSPNAGELNKSVLIRLQEIVTLFRLAVERSRKEVDNQIDALIRREYTSVHPSVEWRFEESACRLIGAREMGREEAKEPPIIFRDVYPLYGQADIVRSSAVRNEAIQTDLVDNLYQIKKVLLTGIEHCRFPLLEQALLETDELINNLKRGVTSSNEYLATEFIRREIHPLFREAGSKKPELSEAVNVYFKLLDPEMGILYRRRKAYEESVNRINALISRYLDEEQVGAQEIIPHFYEKYQTDGVAYNIYVGQSMLRGGRFNRIYLSNLRLWQLVTMCEVTRRIAAVQEALPIPLNTAQLILVHSNPLSIRFRLDEKRFDVDGTYNVRYEILKKRIDKALINGTRERLTQAGKIAVVYQHEVDEREYRRYLRYLVKRGDIVDEIEHLELSKMQGVQGLHALRVTVAER